MHNPEAREQVEGSLLDALERLAAAQAKARASEEEATEKVKGLEEDVRRMRVEVPNRPSQSP